jgi:hypothetical protein
MDLVPDQFLTDLSGTEALLEAEQGAVDHMNADHREALSHYATRLLGAETADWRCTGCDPDGIDLQADAKILRLDFPERVTAPAELRKMLVKLAGEARAE